MGVPVSVQELSRMSKMSTNRVTESLHRLRKHGLIEVTPDSVAGKAAAVLVRGVKNIAESSQRVDGAKLNRIVMGNPEVLFGTPQKRKEPPKEKTVGATDK